MFSKLRPIASSTILLASLLLIADTTLLSHGHGETATNLISGNWFFACIPEQTATAKSAPVVVVGTATDPKKGLSVEKVVVRNRSERSVKAVRFNWRLSKDLKERVAVLQGKTGLIDLAIAPGQREPTSHIGLSFANLQRELPPNSLIGTFVLEVSVAEVVYDDGGRWQTGSPGIARVKPVGFSFCRDEACFYDSTLGALVCAAGKGTACYAEMHADGSSMCEVWDCEIN